jgi:hypothetical protein
MTAGAGEHDVMRGPREVSVDGLVNIRDLGGLRRAGVGETPRGVFFRSENVDKVPLLCGARPAR